MLNKEWSPRDISDLKDKVAKLKIQVKPDLPVDEVIRMQLETLMFAGELTWVIAEARWYESKLLREMKNAQASTFLATEGSDRKRDYAAKNSPETRIAEVKYFEAEVYRKLLEETKEDFIALHYSLRAMLKDSSEEKKWNM